MSPTSAAAQKTASHPSLRDRLKDASLLRAQCYSDGAWIGDGEIAVTNPATGETLASVPRFSTDEAT